MRVEANETMKEWVSVGTIISLQDPASIYSPSPSVRLTLNFVILIFPCCRTLQKLVFTWRKK